MEFDVYFNTVRQKWGVRFWYNGRYDSTIFHRDLLSLARVFSGASKTLSFPVRRAE